MTKRPIADQPTRLVKAVARKNTADEATRPVKAVRRREAPRMLPPSLFEARHVRFVERFSLNFTGNDYELEDAAGAIAMRAESRLHVFRGWRYDFTVDGDVRFSMSRKTKLLLLDGLKVFDAQKRVLGEFQQRPTAFSVHFDVVDGEGQPRFVVQQPSEVWTHFSVRRGTTTLAEIERSHRRWDGSARELVTVEDAFTVEFTATVDELERVLIIAAALFLDRLYFSHADNSGSNSF
ncbi:MAG: phospholipid scramblase-related protein [Myxococcales bacterium]|nr:phospholipid scramblase-related protein [Myxococcales bacterium]MDP3499867.1 phospholipid scramblase-related protein [Myxococcales bacterium]